MLRNWRRLYHRSGPSESSFFKKPPSRPLSYYVGFTVVGCITAYTVATVVDIERDKAKKARWLSLRKSFISNASSPLQTQHSNPSALTSWWYGMKDSSKTLTVLTGINLAVFLAWRLPAFQIRWGRWFLHSTRSHPVTMLTSVFSHQSTAHLAFNMLALWSFGGFLHQVMGREQFLAFYLSSGLCSSLGSHVYKAWRRDGEASLGASGAIFAVAGACAHFPHVNVSLIFLPFHSFPLEKALPCIMLFDLAGLVMRWKVFDHAAHLSGALAGYAGYILSTQRLWPKRRKILKALGYPLS